VNRYGIEQDEWTEWWETRGHERLSLVLWAAWDPIGAPPLDEYDRHAVRLGEYLYTDPSVDDVADWLGEASPGTDSGEPASERDRYGALRVWEWYAYEMEELGFDKARRLLEAIAAEADVGLTPSGVQRLVDYSEVTKLINAIEEAGARILWIEAEERDAELPGRVALLELAEVVYVSEAAVAARAFVRETGGYGLVYALRLDPVALGDGGGAHRE